MKGLLGIFVLITIASSSDDLTLEEKRMENALFAMAGEKPPHDVPLNHNEPSLYDMLVKSAKGIKESHVEHEHEQKGHEEHKMHEHHDQHAGHGGHGDHGGHAGHSGHDQHSDHMMMMYFHGGCKEVILFDFWRINSCLGLIISCLIIFAMGALYEGLKWFRVYLTLAKKGKETESLPSRVVEIQEGSTTERAHASDVPLVKSASRSQTPEAKHPGPFSPMRLSQAILYIVQLVVAYWLMLIVMTYNIWLTIAVILGAGFGHWIFAALRLANPDGEAADQIATDACH